MRIDAHQHFWIYRPESYPWIRPDMTVLRRDYLPADLEPDLRAAAMDGCLAVQARHDEQESRWLLELAASSPLVLGVIGWVDLCAAGCVPRLESLAVPPGGAKLRGVRHLVQDEADDRFLLRADFQRGISCLADLGLVYDLLLHPRQLPAAARLVQCFPEQSFVLDHLAKPFIKDRGMQPWERDLRALAAFPNVACKLSGMVTEAAWRSWRAADFTPYLDAAYDAFGADRVLFGSDWPVCLLAADYRQVVAIVEQWAAKLDAAGRAKLFGDNARRIYLG